MRRLPSETSLRFLLLSAAVVGSTLAVAEALWYTVFREENSATVRACSANEGYQLCIRSQDHERVLWVLVTGAVVVALGVLGAAAGSALRRGRRRLAPIPAITLSVAEPVLRANGLPSLPVLRSRRAPTNQARADGITSPYVEVGVNWLGLAMSEPARARAVLAHEVAHVRLRDILPSRTSLSLAYVFGVYAVIYLVWTASNGLRPTVEAALRVGVVLGVVVLARLAVLRAREHAADIEAAALEQDALAREFAAVTPARQRLLATHPAPSRRREVVLRPELATRLNWVDGVLVGLTVSVTAPELTRLWRSWFQFGEPAYWAELVGWGLVGLVFGAWSALMVFRAVAGARAGAPPVRLAAFSWLLAASIVVGRFLYGTSLGLPMLFPTTALGVIVLFTLAFGVVAVVYWLHGLIDWWLDLAPTQRRGWAIALPTVLGAAVGAGTLGVLAHLTEVGPLAGEGGFTIVQVLLTEVEAVAVATLLGVAVLAVVLLLQAKPRIGGPLPSWLDATTGPARPRVPVSATVVTGLLAGFGATAAYSVYAFGWQPTDAANRSWYVAAATAYAGQTIVGGVVAAGAIAAALVARRGALHHGTIAAVVGSVVATAGAWSIRSIDRNRADFSLLSPIFFDVLVIAVVGALVGSAVLLTIPLGDRTSARNWAPTAAIVAAGVALVALGVAGLRAVPTVEQDFRQFTMTIDRARDDLAKSVEACVLLTASEEGISQAGRALSALRAPSSAPATPQVRETHGALVSALSTCERAFRSAMDRGDPVVSIAEVEPALQDLKRFQSLYSDLEKAGSP